MREIKYTALHQPKIDSKSICSVCEAIVLTARIAAHTAWHGALSAALDKPAPSQEEANLYCPACTQPIGSNVTESKLWDGLLKVRCPNCSTIFYLPKR